MVRFKDFIARFKTQIKPRKGIPKRGKGLFIVEFWDEFDNRGWYSPAEIFNFDDHRDENAIWYMRATGNEEILPFRYLDSWVLDGVVYPRAEGGKTILRIKHG